MNVFGEYAALYNLMYGEKEYGDESEFVISQLREFKSPIDNILDLGCGTGAHALRFSQSGLNVLGVDLSADMLSLARRNLAGATSGAAGAVEFHHSDIRDLRLDRRFDAVVSLFHVMSYQVHDEDLIATIAGARRHISSGCPFLFDFWHGPAVIKAGPAVRRKEVEDEFVRVVRLATPSWEKSHNRVKVVYDFTVDEKATGRQRKFEEIHTMRYFFPEELEHALQCNGFHLAKCAEWLTGKQASNDSFSAYVVAVAT